MQQKLLQAVGNDLKDIERKGRYEVNLKIKKRDIRKKTVVLIPNVGKTGKLDNILVIVS